MDSFINKYISYFIALLSVFVAIITLHDVDCLISPGTDDSYRWAINYLLVHDRQAFAHITYPVGPLCLLKWPSVVGNHLIISAIFQLLLNTTFCLLFIRLYRRHHVNSNLSAPFLLCLAYLTITNFDYALLGVIACGLMLYKDEQRRYALAIAIVFTALALYIKASMFTFAFCLLLSFCALAAFRKGWKTIGYTVAAFILSYTIIGMALLGSFTTAMAYAGHNLFIAFTYTDALNIYTHNNCVAIALCFVLIVLCLALYRRQAAGYMIALFLLCLAATWKYAIGQEAFFHQIYFSFLLTLMLLLFIAVQEENRLRGIVILISALCLYNYNFRYTVESPCYFWYPGLVNFDNRVLHPQAFKARMLKASKEACKDNVIPAEWKEKIGHDSVDVFPWDLSIIWSNDLYYKPRPSLQSPPMSIACEADDVRYLNSAAAPRYIIWHDNNGGKTMLDGIDDGYLLNQCPELFKALLSNYKRTSVPSSRFALYERKATPASLTIATIGTEEIAWNKWTPVSQADSNQFIIAAVHVQGNTTNTLRSLLYKKPALYIDYELADGRVMHYNFSDKRAEEGMIMNPLFNDPELKKSFVKRIRFTNDEHQCFGEKITVEWKRAVEQD